MRTVQPTSRLTSAGLLNPFPPKLIILEQAQHWYMSYKQSKTEKGKWLHSRSGHCSLPDHPEWEGTEGRGFQAGLQKASWACTRGWDGANNPPYLWAALKYTLWRHLHWTLQQKKIKNQALKNVIHDTTAPPIFLTDNRTVILSQGKCIFKLPKQKPMSLSFSILVYFTVRNKVCRLLNITSFLCQEALQTVKLQ